jgi:DNA replication initiation complex subunit (GINS family)
MLVTSSQVDAQNKSFERKTHKIVKKETMDLNKCMDIIASNEEMSKTMLNKIGAEYKSNNSVLDNSNDIKALMPQMKNEITLDKIKNKRKSLNFNKSYYKKR